MRELNRGEAVIQFWKWDKSQESDILPLVRSVSDALKEKPELGTIIETEGPTFHLPDFFDELYGSVNGFLVYVANADPIELKRFVMDFENVEGQRFADIDVYTSYFDKISRKDLK